MHSRVHCARPRLHRRGENKSSGLCASLCSLARSREQVSGEASKRFPQQRGFNAEIAPNALPPPISCNPFPPSFYPHSLFLFSFPFFLLFSQFRSKYSPRFRSVLGLRLVPFLSFRVCIDDARKEVGFERNGFWFRMKRLDKSCRFNGSTKVTGLMVVKTWKSRFSEF